MRLPSAPIPVPEFIVGETYPGYSHHIRRVGDVAPCYGGHLVKPKSLCDRDLAWDTRAPLASVVCRTCRTALITEQKEPS